MPPPQQLRFLPSSTSTAPTTPFTPPLFSSSSSNTSISTPVSNPLIKAGLVPHNLADILAVGDVQNKPTKRRVIKARVLTEQEFYETLMEKDRLEKEKEQLKEQRKMERQKKKEEREKLMRERAEEREKKKQAREEKKKNKEATKGTRKRKRALSPSSSSSESGEEVVLGDTNEASSSASRRRVRLPSRFRVVQMKGTNQTQYVKDATSENQKVEHFLDRLRLMRQMVSCILCLWKELH